MEFDSKKIREIFLNFFFKKDHFVVESSSLIPADPTVFFTSAGMQQFIPYLSGSVEPPYKKAVSVQKCFRTSDIEEVGDESHNTFFEMLGNWSFNDYFKEEAIDFALELLVKGYHLSRDKLNFTVFAGSENLLPDTETIEIWKNKGFSVEKIKKFGMKDNFWGPVGETGPCGPCSEIHYDLGKEYSKTTCTINGCGPNCGCGRFIEIWNLVFMEYNKTTDKKFEKLSVRNIDTGAGLERISMILQKTKSVFETDLFLPIIKKIEELSQEKYKSHEKSFRIIADHARAICFLITDGVLPSKEDRGYVLRRIIRRAIRYGHFLKITKNFLPFLANVIVNEYGSIYTELKNKKNDILTVVQQEEENFKKTLAKGLKQLDKLLKSKNKDQKLKIIDGKECFYLYETFGFPLELIKELAAEQGFSLDEKGFAEAFSGHQKISRVGVEKKFGGGGELSPKLHTATHLLHTALRQVLGEHVEQSGSDINPERLRFDFTHPKRLSDEEIKLIEKIINEKIKENLPVKVEEMAYQEAIKSGALAFFKERYPKIVKVYSIGSFSKEICAGPHVKSTGELGQFKITKEKASMAGVRRIKAVLSNHAN